MLTAVTLCVMADKDWTHGAHPYPGPEVPQTVRTLLAGLPGAPRLDGTLLERMGIRVVHASAERVVATMPVTGNTQPYGLLHGGASAALAETVGSLAATLHAAPSGLVAIGTDLNATHHRSVNRGLVTAVATPASLGRGVACYEVVITDDTGHRICSARVTCLLRRPRPA